MGLHIKRQTDLLCLGGQGFRLSDCVLTPRDFSSLRSFEMTEVPPSRIAHSSLLLATCHLRFSLWTKDNDLSDLSGVRSSS